MEKENNCNSIKHKISIPLIEVKENQSNNKNNANKKKLFDDNRILDDISKKKKREKGNDAKVIKKEIGDFTLENSEAYRIILQNFGPSIRFIELLGIINSIDCFLSMKYGTRLPLISRNEKRSFLLLVKYIERNKNLICPYFQHISLCDSSFQKIPLDNG